MSGTQKLLKVSKKLFKQKSVINLQISIMARHSSLFLCLVILLVFMIISTNGLQCHICGQFNDGVGSITPCLNYTETNAHLHLKECPRKSDKFCVVSIWHYFSSNSSFISQSADQQFSIKSFFAAYVIKKHCFFAVWLRDR